MLLMVLAAAAEARDEGESWSASETRLRGYNRNQAPLSPSSLRQEASTIVKPSLNTSSRSKETRYDLRQRLSEKGTRFSRTYVHFMSFFTLHPILIPLSSIF